MSEYINSYSYKRIFDGYIDSQSKKGILLKDRRRYFTYDNISELITEDKAKEFIDEMVKRKIIKRGYLVKCNECSHAFWVSIDNIKDHIICNQCDCNLFYTYDLSYFGGNCFEPKIYYKLDEIFFHGWKNDFYVPILALNYFKKQSTNYFEYMNEIDIFEDDKKYAEVDFICNVDGQLIIGECKKNNKIEESQIDKYVYIASNCGCDEVVFVTMEEWSKDTNDLIKKKEKQLVKFGINVTLLNGHSLII